MARLEHLGITINLGDERLARVRERFPDLTMTVELDAEKAPRALNDVDAFAGRAVHFELLSDAPRLRWVQTVTAGADPAALPIIAERGIVLTNGSGVHAPNLGEHVLGLMLAFARGFPRLYRAQINHSWIESVPQFELHDQTLCVVGLGEIGLAIAERAAAIGMRVTGVRRRDLPVPPFVSDVAQIETMDPLLAAADHVAVCLPLTRHTDKLFDADRLGVLRSGAYIYNTGRGEVIDQNVMVAMLKSGRLGGAGLDVTDPEPLPENNPLWDLENVIITSHTGGRSPQRLDRFVELLIDNIERFRSDQPLRNVVDLDEGY